MIIKCKECNGTGHDYSGKRDIVMYGCFECDGLGEVEVETDFDVAPAELRDVGGKFVWE